MSPSFLSSSFSCYHLQSSPTLFRNLLWPILLFSFCYTPLFYSPVLYLPLIHISLPFSCFFFSFSPLSSSSSLLLSLHSFPFCPPRFSPLIPSSFLSSYPYLSSPLECCVVLFRPVHQVMDGNTFPGCQPALQVSPLLWQDKSNMFKILWDI